jgi:hypothetical protein
MVAETGRTVAAGAAGLTVGVVVVVVETAGFVVVVVVEAAGLAVVVGATGFVVGTALG